MSLLTANKIGVVSGTITMPLSGVWVADLVIDQPDGTGFDAGTAVTLAADNGFELHGTVAPNRSGSFLDSVHVRMVGGAAGMAKTVTPRGYVQPGAYVGDVLNGIVSDCGETLDSSILSSLLKSNVVAWSTFQLTAAQALNALLAVVAPTANWRFLDNGKLWVGVETWPTSSDAFDVISFNPMEGTAELAVNSPSILPGVNLSGVGNVNHVEHHVDAGALRSHVFLDMPGAMRGAQSAIATIVAQEMASVDYFGLYECKVVSQSADLSTVDVSPLAPVDKKLPGLQRVEVRAGTGIKIQFVSGAKVLLGWKGGNPTLPFVVQGLGADDFSRIQVGGNTDAARKNDTLTAATAITTWAKAVETALSTATSPIAPLSAWDALANGAAGALGKIAVGSGKVGLG